MRKIFITALLLASALMANQINWAKDYNSAIETAKKEHKPVMFVISRHTCKYCVILEKTTFSDDRVIKALNKDFVSVVSYTDERDYIPAGMYQGSTPSTWFLFSDGEPMYQPVVGAIGADSFLGGLQSVKQRFDNLSNGKKK